MIDAATRSGLISDLTRGQIEEPITIVFLCISIAAPIAMLVALRWELRDEGLRRLGLTPTVASLFTTGMVTIGTLGIGLAVLSAARTDLPWWTGGAILMAAAVMTAAIVFFQMRHRASFSWERFVNTIAVPLIAAAIPLSDFAQFGVAAGV